MSIIPATSLIKCDVQIWDLIEQWRDFVDGGNGCLYEIPWNYQWVVELSLEDKNLREIRPDLRWKYMKYWRGIKVDNGSIYCMPFNDSRLKNLLKSSFLKKFHCKFISSKVKLKNKKHIVTKLIFNSTSFCERFLMKCWLILMPKMIELLMQFKINL